MKCLLVNKKKALWYFIFIRNSYKGYHSHLYLLFITHNRVLIIKRKKKKINFRSTKVVASIHFLVTAMNPSLLDTGNFRNINKVQRRQKIAVITSAGLCRAFGKKQRAQRRLRDLVGRNIHPLSSLLFEYEDRHLFYSVNSFYPCLCP